MFPSPEPTVRTGSHQTTHSTPAAISVLSKNSFQKSFEKLFGHQKQIYDMVQVINLNPGILDYEDCHFC